MRKLLLSIVIAILVLLLLAVAFVLAANWRDAPLSDDARAVLDAEPAKELPGISNGYPIIAGLDAPLEGDPVDAASHLGKQRLQREIERKQWFDQRGFNADATKAPPPVEPPSSVKATQILPDDLRCKTQGSTSPNCHEWHVQHATQLQPLIAAQQPMLQRLAAAADAPQFKSESPVYFWHLLPPYQVLMRTHELQLARSSLLWHSGQQEQALREAMRGGRIAHGLGDGTTQLVSSMIALAMQYRTQRWLADLMATGAPPQSPKVRELTKAMMQTPPPSLHSGLVGEAQFQARTMQLVGNDKREWKSILNEATPERPAWRAALESAWVHMTWLPNESLNQQVKWWQIYLPTTLVPAHEYDAALKAFEQQETDLRAQRSRWFGVRNFAGNVLADIGKPNFSTYIQRRFDVDAHRRMVMLMLQAKEQQISDENMPAWLAQSPENLRNPYTLEPMQWDAATRSLVFEGRESQNQNPGNSKTYRAKF